jgi:periplasmic mercuric ion binding protein
MKTFQLKSILTAVLLLFIFSVSAQKAAALPRKAESKIKSTVECPMCKKNVEKNLSKLKGIRKVNADYKTQEITVVYNPRRISLDEIKKAISDMGYDADEVKANNRLTKELKHKEQQAQ